MSVKEEADDIEMIDEVPVPKASYQLQLGKEEIKRMIKEGSLEKVSDTIYRTKVTTLNDMKTKGKPVVEMSAASTSGTSNSPNLVALLPLGTGQGLSTPTLVEVQQPIKSIPGPSKRLTRSEVSSSSGKRKLLPSASKATKEKKRYKYATPDIKPTKNKAKNSVSDYNSSEDDEDLNKNSRSLSKQLASVFFKKIGESAIRNKSLLDNLHQSIFEEQVSDDSDSEDERMSDVERDIGEIANKKSTCDLVNCPGPGKIETHVGPGKNSKLSIIRSHETKTIRNFLYEVYKVRVTSAGREANTNILIPIPEGYKFQYPIRSPEESVEFSHLPHKDNVTASSIHPAFLEQLASTKIKLRKYKDEIKVLRNRYLELLQEYANRPQFSTLSDLVGASAKFLTEDQLVFFLMQLKSGAHNMQGIRYSVREKVLALSIYQKSPEMYKWLRKMFNMPTTRILNQWLEDVAKHDTQMLKKLMYHVYISNKYKPVSSSQS